MEEVHMLGPRWRKIIADFLIFLCFHVFLFIIFLFPVWTVPLVFDAFAGICLLETVPVQNAYL